MRNRGNHTVTNRLPATFALIGLVAGLSITGCGGASHQAPDANVPLPAATATLRQATVSQWASLVAQQKATLEKALKPWEKNSCSSLSLDYPLCYATLITLQYTAETTNLVLKEASDPDQANYLGTPPAEISDLVAQTVDAANTAGSLAGRKKTRATAGALKFKAALDDLQSSYAGWAPYL
jgi:hypothetical protein